MDPTSNHENDSNLQGGSLLQASAHIISIHRIANENIHILNLVLSKGHFTEEGVKLAEIYRDVLKEVLQRLERPLKEGARSEALAGVMEDSASRLVDSTRELLAAQRERMTILLGKSDWNRERTTASTLTPERLTTTGIDSETLHALKDGQLALTRAFQFWDQASSVKKKTGVDNLVDEIKAVLQGSLFLVRPSDVSERLKCIDILLEKGALDGWFRSQQKAMVDPAKQWVEEELQFLGHRQTRPNPTYQDPSVTVRDLESTHDHLAESLLKLFETQRGGGNRTGRFEGSENIYPNTFASALRSSSFLSGGSRNLLVSVAICGMVKAGKTFFLNALVGQDLLPSGELPATAVPCRVRHVPGQKVPVLEVDTNPFSIGLQELRERKYGKAMAEYQPTHLRDLDTDPFGTLFGSLDTATLDFDLPMEESSSSRLLREVHSQWVDLDRSTRSNLVRFEDESFVLASRAVGKQAVVDLLAELNDIVRLCYRFGIGLPMHSATWPLVSVEFEALRDQALDGTFQFIDLPGIGESFSSGQSKRGVDVFDPFDQVICRVSKEADAMIPIVSFLEIPKGDWRRTLPPMIKSGIGRAPEFVICTHLDQVNGTVLQEQIAAVAKTFWPSIPIETASKRVLPCSSLLGMSALHLLRQSATEKPTFEEVWDQNSLGFYCSGRVLGSWNPKQTFSSMTLGNWKDAVEAQLSSSRLYATILTLTMDLVGQSRRRLLRKENAHFRYLVSDALRDQKVQLMGILGAEEHFKRAQESFLEAKSQFDPVLHTWDATEKAAKAEVRRMVATAIDILRTTALKNLRRNVDATYGTFLRDRARKKTPLSPMDWDGGDKLLFAGMSESETFLFSIHQRLRADLLLLKNQFMAFIRTVCELTLERFLSKVEAITDASARKEPNNLGYSVRFRLPDLRVLVFPHNEQGGTPGAFETVLVNHVSLRRLIELALFEEASNWTFAFLPWVLGKSPLVRLFEKRYVLSKDGVVEKFIEQTILPLSKQLEKEGTKIVNRIAEDCSKRIQDTIRGTLENEERWFAEVKDRRARANGGRGGPDVVLNIATLCAAEAVLMDMDSRMKVDEPSEV